MSATSVVTAMEVSRKVSRARRLWAGGKRKFATSLMREAHADLQAVRLQETKAFVERMHEVCAQLEAMKATLDKMVAELRSEDGEVLARTEEAEGEAPKRFDHPCTCGGYAHSMNGRDPADPHTDYCPQRAQYNEWYQSTQQGDE